MPANPNWFSVRHHAERAQTSITPRPARRKGVAAILAMMFLILFGSLSAAMAIASRGNVTTAATHLHVSRAHSAAETGLRIAQSRLRESANRFLAANSDMNGTFCWDMWSGNSAGMGTVSVIPGATSRQDLPAPAGIAAALAEAHALDQNIVTQAGISTVTIGNAVAGATGYRATNWVFTPAVAIEPANGSTPGLCYSIIYAPLSNGTDVRAIVTGYDFAYTRNGMPITRTVMQDFRLNKRVNHAIISPSRVMLGKNVHVTGDLGCRFSDVAFANGDPLITRSDFRGLSASLDRKLDYFYNAVDQYDVDNDNRLRVGHPTESQGISTAASGYASGTGDTSPSTYADVTGDGFVDDFDIFITTYDANADGKVTKSEFSTGGVLIDADLFYLIDSSNPDRNRNGLYGFIDSNANGRRETSELFVDVDTSRSPHVNRDQVLGYLDDVIDKRDRYVKVNGSLAFKTSRSGWESQRGDVNDKIHGAIRPLPGFNSQTYNVSDNDLPNVGPNIFTTTQNDLQAAANGSSFASQIASPLPVPNASAPVVQTLQADANLDGLPDNSTSAHFEKMPYNSPNFSDYYYRPVFKNIVFRDVQIPMGTNALFENCWFIGVTWIRCDTTNTHPLWSEYGKLAMPSGQTRPVPAVARTIYGDSAGETSYPTMLPSSATPPSQMILMANPPLDKADIPANQVAYTAGYDNLPDPLVISGLRITDTKSRSNNLRFHDCLFVGSVVSDAPSGYTQMRNKVQFTGKTRFVRQNPEEPNSPTYNPDSADLSVIDKSSLMLPNYSVDVGTFNTPAGQSVSLSGVVIAGVLDVRGNASIDGALLLTYRPVHGQGPLQDVLGNPVGNPAGFNTTLGYFGPNDGDEESLDPGTLPVVGGVRIVGWDTNGDGLADVAHDQPQPSGSVAVPFHGFGSIQVRFNPNMRLPNGIMLPMQYDPLPTTYREGRL